MNKLSPDELRPILQKTFKQTAVGALNWTRVTDENYRVVFPRSALELLRDAVTKDVVLAVQNSDGEYIGVLNTKQQSTTPHDKESLIKLFEIAQRKAFKA